MAAAIGVWASPIMLAPPADDRRPGACLPRAWKARLVDVPARRGVAVPVLRPCRTALGHHKTDVTWDGQNADDSAGWWLVRSWAGASTGENPCRRSVARAVVGWDRCSLQTTPMLQRNSHVGRNVGSADEDSRAATARIDRAARLGKGRIRPPRTSRGSGVIGYGSGVSLQFNKIFKLFSLKLYRIRVRFF